VRAANGVKSVKIPLINTLPPNIHLAPNFSAKFPVKYDFRCSSFQSICYLLFYKMKLKELFFSKKNYSSPYI
jgi:hypothetical protein